MDYFLKSSFNFPENWQQRKEIMSIKLNINSSRNNKIEAIIDSNHTHLSRKQGRTLYKEKPTEITNTIGNRNSYKTKGTTERQRLEEDDEKTIKISFRNKKNVNFAMILFCFLPTQPSICRIGMKRNVEKDDYNGEPKGFPLSFI